MTIDLSNLNSTTSSTMSHPPIALSVSDLTIFDADVETIYSQDSSGTSQSGSGLEIYDDLREDRERLNAMRERIEVR